MEQLSLVNFCVHSDVFVILQTSAFVLIWNSWDILEFWQAEQSRGEGVIFGWPAFRACTCCEPLWNLGWLEHVVVAGGYVQFQNPLWAESDVK